MYEHKLMMKANGGFIDGECLLVQPVPSVFEQLMQPCWDLAPVAANVLVRRPEGSCPSPRVPEHSAVQDTAELFAQHILDAGAGEPLNSFEDVCRLPFVECALCRDVGGNELRRLIWVQGRLAWFVVEGYRHRFDHLPVSSSCRRCRICCCTNSLEGPWSSSFIECVTL